jgi:hypothetical protein
MIKHQENKLTMYRSVQSLLQANVAVTATVPAVGALETEFGELLNQIQATSVARDQATLGKRSFKAGRKDALVTAILHISAGLVAYARSQEDAELKEKAVVRQSQLRRLRDTDLAARGRAIFILASDRVAVLETYGITPQTLTDFEATIIAYDEAIGIRESSVAERVGARHALNALFRKTDTLLQEGLDGLIEQFRDSHRQFYDEYWSAKVIKDIGIRHEKPKETESVTTGEAAA